MKTYESWIAENPDTGTAYTFADSAQIADLRLKGLIEPHARLMFKVQADTSEEATAVRNVKLGWSPYIPMGEPARCPNECGAVVYPAGSGECPNCGVLSEEQYTGGLASQEAVDQSTLRAVIKSIEIGEASGLPAPAYKPEDATDFRCTFTLMIGPPDAIRAEQVRLIVCSPKWLAKACEKDGFTWCSHNLIVPEYDLGQITSMIGNSIERCSGESWTEVANKLHRMAAWEIGDWQPG